MFILFKVIGSCGRLPDALQQAGNPAINHGATVQMPAADMTTQEPGGDAEGAKQVSREQWMAFLSNQTGKLSKQHEHEISDNYVTMMQALDIERIWSFLVEDGILSFEQQELIITQPTMQAKRRQLISIVKKRGEMGYFSLRRALLCCSYDRQGECQDVIIQILA